MNLVYVKSHQGGNINVSEGIYPLIPNGETLHRNISTQKHSKFGAYSSLDIYDICKQTIVKKLHQNNIKKENIYISDGTYGGGLSVVQTFLYGVHGYRQMLGVGPQFPDIPKAFSVLQGAQYHSYDSIQELSQKIYESPKSIIYIDNPTNPSGNTYSIDQLKILVHQCNMLGSVLVVDEAFGDFIKAEESAVQLVNTGNNIIVLKSLSKAYGLGEERIGIIIASDNYAEQYGKTCFVPFRPTSDNIHIANKFMEQFPTLEPYLHIVQDKKERLINILKEKGIHILPTHKSTPIFLAHSKDIVSILAKKGIIGEPGSTFEFTDKKMTDDYIRIVVPHNNDTFDALCKEMATISIEETIHN